LPTELPVSSAINPPPVVSSSKFRLSKKPAAIVILVFLIAVTVFFFLIKPQASAPTLVNAYTSDQDSRSQETIKELTGYDWSNIPKNLGGSEKQMLAGLLLLYSEQSSVFRTEIPSISLNRLEAENLGLEEISTDVNKENVTKLFEMLIKAETSFQGEGLIPATAHLERLEYLKAYFDKSLPIEKNKIPEDAKKISSDLVIAEDHSSYLKAILERYNNWLEFVNAQ
jgi:hypothetical protein